MTTLLVPRPPIGAYNQALINWNIVFVSYVGRHFCTPGEPNKCGSGSKSGSEKQVSKMYIDLDSVMHKLFACLLIWCFIFSGEQCEINGGLYSIVGSQQEATSRLPPSPSSSFCNCSAVIGFLSFSVVSVSTTFIVWHILCIIVQTSLAVGRSELD